MAEMRLRIPDSELPRFQKFLDTPVEELLKIKDSILGMPGSPAISAMRTALFESGYDREIVDSFTGVLTAATSLTQSNENTLGEVLDAMRAALARQSPAWWNNERWDERRLLLESLGSAGSPVHLMSKAVAVNTEGSGLTIGVKILTETRWIFSDDASSVLGAITRHLLSINHTDTQGNEATSVFVLDTEDLTKIKEQAERALIKSETVRLLTETANTPTLNLHER